MKQIIKKRIASSKFLSALFIKMNNRFCGKGIQLRGQSIRKNNICITGTGNVLTCGGSCSIQNCNMSITGLDNHIQFGNHVTVHGGMMKTVQISGHHNQVTIEDDVCLDQIQIFICGDNNEICIKKNCSGVFVQFHIEQNNNKILIDEGTTMHGREHCVIHMALDEGTTIHIAEDCMLSNDIQIRTSDSHSIVDAIGNRTNPAKDIKIGRHVWIGMRAMIMKGCVIPDHTIVAAGSICTKRYDQKNTVIGGNPAKILKSDVDWDRKFL